MAPSVSEPAAAAEAHSRTQLPQELVDLIIDFVCDDKKTLHACTVTARYWLPSSRLHLFANVQVSEQRFTDFLAFAQTCTCGPQYIVDLKFNGHQPQQQMDNRSAITPAYLHTLLACLPRLEYLLLFMTRFRDSEENEILSPTSLSERPVSSMSTLKSLKIYYSGAHDDRFIHLAHVLSTFRSIDRLHLRFQSFCSNHGPDAVERELSGTPIGDIMSLPVVQALVVDDNAFRTNLYLLVAAKSRSFDTLRTLEVQSRRLWDHRALGLVLRQVGVQLEHLSLQISGLSEPDDVDNFVRDFSFSSCIALATLALHVAPNPFHHSSLSWTTLCALIGSLSSETPLQHVSLHIGPRMSMEDVLHPWNGMDEVLSKFGKLEQVTFLHERFAELPEAGEELIRGAFPRIARKAKIDFALLS